MNSKTIEPSAGTVAIVGRPNVGKSALFNRLVGRNIAIVHDQPGITRDRLASLSTRGRRPFTVWDTGGIGGAGETELTAQVRLAADAAMRESDVILFVVDAQAGLNPIDQELAKLLRKSKRPVALVVNKIDHEKHENLESDFARLGFDNSIAISSAHGRGIPTLLEAIDSLLPQSKMENQSAVGGLKIEAAPLSLAIVGKPNAGKSSLINAILRDTRTIVSELPGTTRDAVDILYERAGERFLLIDTAGMRARSKHSTSVEVFSVMRAERTIRRADLCVLVIDLTSGVTSQDKRIAGLIQQAEKPCVVVLNKWDLVKPSRGAKGAMDQTIADVRERLFFLDYAPVLVGSARTGENVDQLFRLISVVRKAAGTRIGTGVLNRLLRAAFEETPPPMIGTKRLKLFYAAQTRTENEEALEAAKIVLFVNQPKLLSDTYSRYLERRIRAAWPFPGLPVLFSCRARSEKA
ncbi:MAG TPA: ribosome biogenesis GTPase Der [Chthoniobacterales bacterium]|jgi:GTP-binding protein|nr:ribosome biogenesis GTPase Der [Chthoniobacterales bacterium]